MNQVPEALKIIESIQNPSLKIKELKAQILYRLEKFEDCFAVYRDIIKNSTDDYEDERETNLSAVIVNLVNNDSVCIYTNNTKKVNLTLFHKNKFEINSKIKKKLA